MHGLCGLGASASKCLAGEILRRHRQLGTPFASQSPPMRSPRITARGRTVQEQVEQRIPTQETGEYGVVRIEAIGCKSVVMLRNRRVPRSDAGTARRRAEMESGRSAPHHVVVEDIGRAEQPDRRERGHRPGPLRDAPGILGARGKRRAPASASPGTRRYRIRNVEAPGLFLRFDATRCPGRGMRPETYRPITDGRPGDSQTRGVRLLE